MLRQKDGFRGQIVKMKGIMVSVYIGVMLMTGIITIFPVVDS